MVQNARVSRNTSKLVRRKPGQMVEKSQLTSSAGLKTQCRIRTVFCVGSKLVKKHHPTLGPTPGSTYAENVCCALIIRTVLGWIKTTTNPRLKAVDYSSLAPSSGSTQVGFNIVLPGLYVRKGRRQEVNTKPTTQLK